MTKRLPGYTDDIDDGIVVDGDFEDTTDLQNDIDGEMDRLVSEIGANPDGVTYKIKAYRIKGDGTYTWLFDAPLGDPIMEKLRDSYGGGNFEIRVLKGNKIFRRPKVEIEAPIKSEEKQRDGEIGTVLKYVTAGMDKLADAVKDINSRQLPQQNPMEMFGAMMGAMVQMKQLMGDSDKGAGATVKDMIELIQLGRNMAGGDGEVSPMLEAVRTFGPLAAKALNHEMSKPRVMTTPPQVPVAQGSQQPRPNPKPLKENPEVNKIKQAVSMLVAAAKADKDVELYADLVIDNIPEPALVELLSGDVKSMLSMYHPEVGSPEVWPWFERLIAAITESEDSEPELTGDVVHDKDGEKEINPTSGDGENDL